MARWIKATKGVRYKEHETRKHGVSKDRYYTIFYRVNGKQIEEGLGWASEGWTEDEAVEVRAALRKNRRNSEGPRTLAEKKAIEEKKRRKEAEQKEQEARDNITFSEYALGAYKASRDEKTWTREEQVIRLWLESVIGALPLKDIAPFHFEIMRANMAKANRARHTVRYVQGVARQIFNHAMEDEKFTGLNPARTIKKGKGRLKLPDNKRLRFLTREQADELLAKLATISPEVRDMSLISLHTGMRAGEVFGLVWQDVDVNKGLLAVKDTKSGKNRTAFMTEAVKEVFRSRERGLPSEFVFPANFLA